MKIIIYWRFRKYKYIQIIIYWIFQTCLAVGTFAGSVQVLVHVSYLSKMQNVNKNVYILFIFHIDFTHVKHETCFLQIYRPVQLSTPVEMM